MNVIPGITSATPGLRRHSAKQSQGDDFQPFVGQKLVSEFLGNAATRLCHEQDATARCEAISQAVSLGLEVQKTGLVVTTTHPWLSASLDSAATSPQSLDGSGLLEVKCPYSCLTCHLPKQLVTHSSFYLLMLAAGALHLKEAHQYCYHVQFQLFVTGHSWVDFFVWTPGEVFRQHISPDTEFAPKYLDKLRPALNFSTSFLHRM